MFVLPPPPKFPSARELGAAAGHLIETSNSLSTPDGPEYKLVAGEGTYVLRDDLLLATPPPHPSEPPTLNQNPLTTAPTPPTAGTRLSITIFAPLHSSLKRNYRTDRVHSSGSALKVANQDLSSEVASVASVASDGGPTSLEDSVNGATATRPPVFGEDNPSIAIASNSKDAKDPLKRRKPKNNILKSNSSFVSRVITHESLAKRLQERNPAGVFAFANIHRGMQWLDLSSDSKAEHLTKILFTKAHPLCHDVNPVTRCSSHLDVVLGFSSGDIIWYEPMSQKYARINKNGAINASAVSDIRWIPGSENLFLASHTDGTLVVYDKEKDDTGFVAEEPILSLGRKSNEGEHAFALHIKKSVQSRNQKANPVAVWKVLNQRINAFSFSPDCRHLALVAEDGSLRVLDYLEERVLDVYMSYYGGLMSVCWSPDGRYIVTGGQDDLVSIWSLEECALVARCPGHNSWVTAVAFDPWRCDDRNYRFGSVGEDCRLLLWDFSVGMLHKPRAASVRRRSISAPSNRLRSTSSLAPETEDKSDVFHPVQPRAATAMLPPVMAKSIDEHPLSWLGFEEDCIMTACNEGHIRMWNRPNEGCVSNDGVPSTSVSNL